MNGGKSIKNRLSFLEKYRALQIRNRIKCTGVKVLKEEERELKVSDLEGLRWS